MPLKSTAVQNFLNSRCKSTESLRTKVFPTTEQKISFLPGLEPASGIVMPSTKTCILKELTSSRDRCRAAAAASPQEQTNQAQRRRNRCQAPYLHKESGSQTPSDPSPSSSEAKRHLQSQPGNPPRKSDSAKTRAGHSVPTAAFHF